MKKSNFLKYACNVCNKTYNAINKKRNHERIAHIEKKYYCIICSDDIKIYSATELANHRNLYHKNEIRYECKICINSKFIKTNDLYVHIQKNHIKYKYKCNYNNCKIESNNYRKFYKDHGKDIYKHKNYIDCKYCNQKFPNHEWLYKHLRKIHSNIIKKDKYLCCNILYQLDELCTHFKNFHTKCIICEACNKRCINENTYNNHLYVTHMIDSKHTSIKYKCKECNKFMEKDIYINHIQNCSVYYNTYVYDNEKYNQTYDNNYLNQSTNNLDVNYNQYQNYYYFENFNQYQSYDFNSLYY